MCLAVLFLSASPVPCRNLATTGAFDRNGQRSLGRRYRAAPRVTATSHWRLARNAIGYDGRERRRHKFSLLAGGQLLAQVYRVQRIPRPAEVPSVTANITETPVLNQRSSRSARRSEQVTVESTAETIQTQNATVGALVGSKEVTDLPLSSRNYTQIIDLSPGVVANVSSAAAGG